MIIYSINIIKGLGGNMSIKLKKNMLKEVESYDFWHNSAAQSISQIDIHKIVCEFRESADNGKKKKVAIIGWDGARADSLANIFPAKVIRFGKDIVSGHYSKPACSGCHALLDMGGAVYLAYCGGETGTSTEQETSTVGGWSSLLTGKWAVNNGIYLPKSASAKEKANHVSKISLDSPTLLRRFAEKHKDNTAFIAQWPVHFTETYVNEVEYLDANPDISMRYAKFDDDYTMHKHVVDSLTEGSKDECDVMICIYEAPDHEGHNSGFGNKQPHYINAIRTCDNYTYDLVHTIQGRPSYANEDWLILVTSDHGGLKSWHGRQDHECRPVFIVSNKIIDPKYYAKGYDGFNCK